MLRTTPSMKSTNSQTSIPTVLPSKKRPQVFGYILRSDWIIDFGQKHNVDPNSKKNEFTLVVDSVKLIRDERKKDGEYALVRYLLNPPQEDMVAQIYVSRNFIHTMRGAKTEELLCASREVEEILGYY